MNATSSRRLRAEQQKQRDAVAQEESHERALVASIQSRKDRVRRRARVAASHVDRRQPVPRGAPAGPDAGVVVPRRRVRCRARSPSAFGQPRPSDPRDRRACTPVSTCRRRPAHRSRPAPAAVVAWAGPRGGYGNAVIIDHGNQFATLYGHASALKVVGRSERSRPGRSSRSRARPGWRPGRTCTSRCASSASR